MNVGRLLNNLGGFDFLLGKPEKAIARLKEAFAVALEHGDDDDVATAVSSLAQVYLQTGDPVEAEEHARHALRRLDGAARIASTRSATHGSYSGARCSSRAASTRPRSLRHAVHVQAGVDRDGEQEVEQRPRNDDKEAPPDALPVEGARQFAWRNGCFALVEHLDVAAERDRRNHPSWRRGPAARSRATCRNRRKNAARARCTGAP